MSSLKIISLVLFFTAMNANAYEFGALTITSPKEGEWKQQPAPMKLPEGVNFASWVHVLKPRGLTFMSHPAAETVKNVDDYFPKWHIGFEKRATEVLGNGFLEINHEKCGYSKILVLMGDKSRITKQYCLVIDGIAYVFGIFADDIDPENDLVMTNIMKSIIIKNRSSISTVPSH